MTNLIVRDREAANQSNLRAHGTELPGGVKSLACA